MKKELISFIKSVQKKVMSDESFRHMFSVTKYKSKLEFGYGYFSADKVVYFNGDEDNDNVEMSVEEGVDLLLKEIKNG